MALISPVIEIVTYINIISFVEDIYLFILGKYV